jgi:hypothetical protein
MIHVINLGGEAVETSILKLVKFFKRQRFNIQLYSDTLGRVWD